MRRLSGLYAAFGARWNCDIALPWFDPASADCRADITVRSVDRLDARPPLRTVNGGTIFADGFRFAWRDEATFDCVDGPAGLRIDYTRGPGWTGDMPFAFAGTVAGLALAWRGALPCHACAVEVQDRAILIAGDAGAGKSTLTAALLRRGHRLIADDLTIVRPMPGGGFQASRGRVAIRLHPATAALLPAIERHSIPGDDRGKRLVRPVARTASGSLPIAGLLLLGEREGRIAPRDGAIRLGPHLFRPRWLAALPNHADRLRTMLGIAASVPCRGLDPGDGFHRDPAAIQRAERAITELLADQRIRDA